MNKLKVLTVAVATALYASGAMATTKTASFQVKLTVTADCTISKPSAGDVDFGTQAGAVVESGGLTANGKVNAKCSKGSAYRIGLDAGSNASTSGDTTTRRMANGTEYVTYDLYLNSGYSTHWGSLTEAGAAPSSTGVISVVSGTGNTADTTAGQDYPVYGKIPAQVAGLVSAGNYLDTVTATVEF